MLLEYLCGYMERVHPLMDQNVLYDEIKRDFEEKWSQGTFPGWRVRLLVYMLYLLWIYLASSVSVVYSSSVYYPVPLSVCALFLQKDTESAMAKHSGAHLDLSAFSSPEVTVV